MTADRPAGVQQGRDWTQGAKITREQAVVTVRNVGQRYGYAVAVHGSGLRDIDLLAVPWVDAPAAPEFLVSELEEALPAVRTSEGETKPHGRMAWALQLPAVGPPDIWYIDLSVMPVVGAVSPEPRGPYSKDEHHGGTYADAHARLVEEGEPPVEDAEPQEEKRGPGFDSGWEHGPALPREGEQEPREPYLVGCPADRCVLEEGHAGRHCMGTGEEFTVHEGVIVAVDRGPEPKVEADNPSVASVLRLTASRLRDPEYHWYEDPAVTLERLAERLEGTEPLTDEECEAVLWIIGLSTNVGSEALESARAKLRARLEREDADG